MNSNLMTPLFRGHKMQLVAGLAIFAAASAVHADIFDLRITEVNALAGQVEVTNFAETTFTVATNLPFTHKGNTASFVPAASTFGPGQSVMIAVAGLDPAASDLWLYSDSSFASPASVIAGLQWGAASQGQTATAVTAGKWPAASFFTAAQTDVAMSLRVASYADVPVDWAIGAPSPGAFFGTGTPITNPIPETIPVDDILIGLVPIATGLASPVTVVQPDDNSNRLFIADQVGRVLVHQHGAVLPTPLLDVTGRLVTFNNFDERGLIGLAVHPNFAANPKIYTLTSEPKGSIPADFPSLVPPNGFNHQGVLAEWTIDANNPNIVDVSTRREIFRVDEPQANHNGGTLQFGPDGFLYIALGDGGNRDDEGPGHLPDGNAQSIDNPLGKLLRIQIDGGPFTNGKYGVPATNPFVGLAGAIPEIWAYGLRNPYFYSFDKGGTNQLYCGDVGQGRLEEINIILPGRNYGWRLKEGSFFFDANGGSPGFVTNIPVKPLPPALEEPIAEYDHDEGISIIGGFVYRGSALPALQGSYIFGDFGMSFSSPSGRLMFMQADKSLHGFTPQGKSEFGYWLKGFGQDQAGEIYACGSQVIGPAGNTGTVFKLVPPRPAAAALWELYD